jgi:hypothetical protein
VLALFVVLLLMAVEGGGFAVDDLHCITGAVSEKELTFPS